MNMKLLFPALLNVALWAGGIMPVVQDEVQPAQHETKHDSKPGNAKAANSGQSEGERVFAAQCSRCHNAPQGFSPRIAGTIVRHMRVRANLSREEERAVLKFFNP
jgi:cytochrome c5